jgi:hypothetical protein
MILYTCLGIAAAVLTGLQVRREILWTKSERRTQRIVKELESSLSAKGSRSGGMTAFLYPRERIWERLDKVEEPRIFTIGGLCLMAIVAGYSFLSTNH